MHWTVDLFLRGLLCNIDEIIYIQVNVEDCVDLEVSALEIAVKMGWSRLYEIEQRPQVEGGLQGFCNLAICSFQSLELQPTFERVRELESCGSAFEVQTWKAEVKDRWSFIERALLMKGVSNRLEVCPTLFDWRKVLVIDCMWIESWSTEISIQDISYGPQRAIWKECIIRGPCRYIICMCLAAS